MILRCSRIFALANDWTPNIHLKLSKPGSFVLRRRCYGSQISSRKPSQKLPKCPARTRFAPSPTGYMHLGSLRTALFNFLLAKATGGQFLLRIEDTDQKRTIPGAEERLLQDLEWAGLQWDEGPKVGGPYGPYKQSERTLLYIQHAERLLASGHAYRCFCSIERLDQIARAQNEYGLSTGYDRACVGISKEESEERSYSGESHTIRLLVSERSPKYDDLVYGRVGGTGVRPKKEIRCQYAFEDPILIKSDGLPTYHLASVVDDHLMNITHVIRAVEWMPSTPKHLAIYDALNWTPPQFAHVGLLQDKGRQKLSKRNIDLDMTSFRKNGFLPEALINYVVLLGWSHDESSDFFTIADLIRIFDLKFTKGNTVVNFQKLDYLQKLHAQKIVEQGGSKFNNMVESLVSVIQERRLQGKLLFIPPDKDLRSYAGSILKADSKQFLSATDFYQRNQNFFHGVESFETKEIPPGVSGVKHELVLHYFSQVPDAFWNEDTLKSKLRDLSGQIIGDSGAACDENNVSISLKMEDVEVEISRYLRWAIMNSRPGPPIVLTLVLLGRREVLARIENRRRISLGLPLSSQTSGG